MWSFDEFLQEGHKGNSFKDKQFIVQNKKMDTDVYLLRRKVMDFIYRAKKLTNDTLPRITIRISDITLQDLLKKDHKILGLASMGECVIWIPECTFKDGYDLQGITYHEILHSVFSIPHIDESPLMKPHVNNNDLRTPEIWDEIFLSHIETPDKTEWKKKYSKKYKKLI